MVRLTGAVTFAGPSVALYDTVASLLVGEAPDGAMRLWSATRAGGGLAAFAIDGPGAPVLVDEQAWSSAVRPPGEPRLALLPGPPGALPVLIAAGLQPGPAASYALTETGGFGRSLRTPAESPLPADTVAAAAFVGADGTALVALARAGQAAPALYTPRPGGVFAPADPGATTHAAAAAGGAAPGVLVALPDGGIAAAWGQGNRIARFEARPDGSLAAGAATDSLASGVGFHLPSAAAATTSGGTAFLIVAAAGSSSLTVFRLTGGTLTPTDHVIDSLHTRFQSVAALATVTAGAHTYVLAGGGDDGVSLLLLLPDGRLVHLGTVADTENTALANVGAIAAGVAGGRVQVFVGSGSEPGITRFTLDAGAPGVLAEGPGALEGSAGADLLLAGPATTALSGGAGDDILVALEGGGGRLALTGGAGADRFVIAEAARHIAITDFDPAADLLDLSLLPMLRSLAQVAVVVTPGGARLTLRDTVIEIATATGGPLPAGALTDAAVLALSRVFGLPFPVTVNGSAAAERLVAAPGGGSVWGQAGADTLLGGLAPASLHGGEGNDLILAGNAGDALFGDEGNDTMRGGEGADSLWGGTGNDNLDGGAGDDAIEAVAGRNILRGGAGNDTLTAGTGLAGRGDVLVGGAGDDRLLGGAAGDQLFGGEGDDELWGGAGDDRLFGISGTNRIYGGAGNDFAQGGTGADTIEGGAGRNMLLGSLGDDVLRAGPSGDTLYGGGGADAVVGGDGPDSLYAGRGHDSVWGGAGDDRLWGNWGASSLWGGAGDDTLQAGTDGDRIWGGDGSDLILGGRGPDTAWGGAGDDLIAGADGNDVLHADGGQTTLWGGAGNDVLHAGAGATRMVGGAGADTFVFVPGTLGTADAAATIADFRPGEDRIDLSAFGLRLVAALVAGGGAQAAWAAGTAGAAGALLIDRDGDGRADGLILMPGAPPPLAGDLIL